MPGGARPPAGRPAPAPGPVAAASPPARYHPPMRTLHFDFSAGCAGDMFLASLVDAGLLSPADLAEGIERLALPGVSLDCFRDVRGGVAGTRIRVLRDGRPVEEIEGVSATAEAAEHHHHHDGHEHHHHRGHDHPERHDHSDSHSHSHSHSHPHRHLSAVLAAVEESRLEREVISEALALFRRLAEVEAGVHGVASDQVFLHEVSADDSIVDVALAARAMFLLERRLGPLEVTGSPVNVGHGTLVAAHGRLPVPPPAVVALLRGKPSYGAGAPGERCTPTGALVIDRWVSRFGPQPLLRVAAVGHGLGTKEFPDGPNALRVVAGEPEAAAGATEPVLVLEADVDDSTGELLGWARERLLAAGALDVVAVGTSMKKGRPGVLLRVLARPGDEPALVRLLFRETTTLGVRVLEARRHVLEREIVRTTTRWGEIPVKVGRSRGETLQVAAEYEAAAKIARSAEMPLKVVMREAETKALADLPTVAPASSSRKKKVLSVTTGKKRPARGGKTASAAPRRTPPRKPRRR